jgi:hypothetical protein
MPVFSLHTHWARRNVGTLIGHSGIRRYGMGEASGERVQATPEEMAAMKKLVREAMVAGALGFSSAPKDRGGPAGVGNDEERWALADKAHLQPDAVRIFEQPVAIARMGGTSRRNQADGSLR